MPEAKETKRKSSIVKPFIGGMAKMNIRVIFIEEVLGATPSDKEIYTNFIGKMHQMMIWLTKSQRSVLKV